MKSPTAAYARYAWFVLIFNMLVILLGTVVRATNSGDGCGSHWPVCNGVLVPLAPALKTMIEYAHRVTSGLDGLLVLGLAIAALRLLPRGHRVRRAAALTLLLTLLEGWIGRYLVKARLVADDASAARALWMSIHLCNTFLLLAACALTAWWADGRPLPRLRGSRALAAMLWGALLLVMLLGISGAVTALGDTLFPVRSHGEVLRLSRDPGAHFLLRLRIWHPYLALAVGAVLWVVAGVAGQRPQARGLAQLVRACFALQVLVGVINLWLRAPVVMQVVHLMVADVLWVAVVLLGAAALQPEEIAAPPVRAAAPPLGLVQRP